MELNVKINVEGEPGRQEDMTVTEDCLPLLKASKNKNKKP